MDRSTYPTHMTHLEDEGPDDYVSRLTPADRVKMVWELTRQAWTFKDGHWDEPRLQRHVARVIRPKDLADVAALDATDDRK